MAAGRNDDAVKLFQEGLAADPDNAALEAYLAQCRQARDLDRPTLPSTLEQELRINPFLRAADPAVQRAYLGEARPVS